MPPTNFQLNLSYRSGTDIFKMAAMVAILDIGTKWLQQF